MRLAAQFGVIAAISLLMLSLSIIAYNNSLSTINEEHKSSASKVINNTVSPIINTYNFNSYTPVENMQNEKHPTVPTPIHRKPHSKCTSAAQIKFYSSNNSESYICNKNINQTSTIIKPSEEITQLLESAPR